MVGVAAWVVPALGPDPNRPDLDRGLTALGAPLAPSGDAPLGTDDLGRDVFARVCYAGRASLLTAATGTALAVLLGLLAGMSAGLVGGALETALARAIELVLAFPILLLALFAATALRAASLDGGGGSLAVVLGLLGWPATARVVHARTRALAAADYVVAARGLGASVPRLVLRHLLPNLAALVTAIAVITLSQFLLAESALSFVGLGPAPPEPSWGQMVWEGRIYYRSAPWLVLAPALAIVVTVAAVHLVAVGLQGTLERVER